MSATVRRAAAAVWVGARLCRGRVSLSQVRPCRGLGAVSGTLGRCALPLGPCQPSLGSVRGHLWQVSAALWVVSVQVWVGARCPLGWCASSLGSCHPSLRPCHFTLLAGHFPPPDPCSTSPPSPNERLTMRCSERLRAVTVAALYARVSPVRPPSPLARVLSLRSAFAATAPALRGR